MTSILEAIRMRFALSKPLEPGIYHYQSPSYAESQYRMHLRIEKNGEGILIINASTVLHLNQTATEYAYHMINETQKEDIPRLMKQRYDISTSQLKDDFSEFQEQVFTLVDIQDLDPVQFLGLEREEPYSSEISAPYRMDLALTYRLPQGVDPEAAPTKRVDRELSTDEWIQIIDKAWDFGVPHIIFTGGEPTLRDDLLELILHAEKNGQVTGLITDAQRLSNPDYFTPLLNSGLDHLLVNLDIEDDLVWQALGVILPEDIFTTVHLTLTPEDSERVSETILKLSDMGVNAMSLTSSSSQVDEDLMAARNLIAETGMELVWDLPVPYSARNPVQLESEDDEIRDGAGTAWMYVEPDGDVLPSQGINKVLGNMLLDEWDKIWLN